MNDLATKIIERLAPLDPVVVYGFGSAFSGRQTADSDIDVAFLPERDVSPEDTFALAQELAVDLGRDVDLIDLRRATTVLRAQVVSTGRVFSLRDPRKHAEFEMYALSDYARLNEEREPVLRRLREGGAIYG